MRMHCKSVPTAGFWALPFSPGRWPRANARAFVTSVLAPAQGVVLVNRQRDATGDGIAAIDESPPNITAEQDAEFLLVDAA
jgi:Quercetinase C-terminal cupin domain